jgi:membrane-associated phospholipid phosphatase
MRKIYSFIDVYPDFATFAIVIMASALQLLIGNEIRAVILSISLMIPTLIFTLPTNVLMKTMFKTKRPKQYYKKVKKRTVFEGSFPSFHSQFSAGEATTFIVGIALFSPENMRLISTLLAICTVGFASVVIAWSRVALNVHYAVDAVGGFIFGVLTGFAVSYVLARSIWKSFPLVYHIFAIFVFVVLVFLLSEKQRKVRFSTKSHLEPSKHP